MNYEREILSRLIEKYEKSKAYSTGIFIRRISLSLSQEKWLEQRLERPEEKGLFLAAIRELQNQGLIDFSWVKFEEGNLVEQIWLIPEETAIDACYRRLGRVPAREKAAGLGRLIEEYRGKLEAVSPLARFLAQYQAQLQKTRQIRSFFTEDLALDEDILRCLVFMEQNQGEQMERLMSAALYGDSKYFERNLKSKVLSILRHLKKQENEEVPSDDELLGEKGIVRWPEILEFTGPISVTLEDGSAIDYASQRYGAYVNSETVKRIRTVKTAGLRRVLFIENKANYIWYITENRREDQLVLYHGGCYSPVKGLWFRKVYEGSRKNPGIAYFHWGDIDAGGFRMFSRLQREIIPELKPYRMDRDTLKAFRGQAMEIQSEAYLKLLEDMGQNPEYEIFHDVIQLMIRERIRLEQESMAIGEGYDVI